MPGGILSGEAGSNPVLDVSGCVVCEVAGSIGPEAEFINARVISGERARASRLLWVICLFSLCAAGSEAGSVSLVESLRDATRVCWVECVGKSEGWKHSSTR